MYFTLFRSYFAEPACNVFLEFQKTVSSSPIATYPGNPGPGKAIDNEIIVRGDPDSRGNAARQLVEQTRWNTRRAC